MSKTSNQVSSKKIISGVKWASVQFVLDTLSRFVIRLVLAKILLPTEFGLVGMSTIFIAVAAAASDLGMISALIQQKDDDRAERMYPTAFWSGIILAVFVYSIISFVIAPFAAYFYKEPMLTKLIPVLSLSILFKPLTMIHTVILTRTMDFKRLGRVLNISTMLAGVAALIAAYLGWGVWSLAINNTLAAVFAIPMFYTVTKWKPVWQWNKLHFNKIFGFGVYSTGTSIFSTITYNIDNLMIGKLLGAALLGSYTLAFSLTEQLRQIVSSVLNKVMYPVFAKSQKDKEQLKKYFLKIVSINALLMYPLMTFLLIFAKDIIIGFFGAKWENTIVPLQVLSVAMMIHLLVNSFTALIRGLGKPDLEMKIIIGLTICVLIPSLYFGITHFGLVGAAYAILLNKIGLAIIGLTVLKREINLSMLTVFDAIKNSLLGVIIASMAIYIVRFLWTGADNVFLLSPIFIAVYLLIIYKTEKSNIQGFYLSMKNK
jgi:teichuronic acid exporter